MKLILKVWEVKRLMYGTKITSGYNVHHCVSLKLCGPYVVALLNPLVSMRVSWALSNREVTVEPRHVFLQASLLGMEFFLHVSRKDWYKFHFVSEVEL